MTFTEWVEKGGLEDLDNMKRPQLIQKAWDFYRDFTPHTRQERTLKNELLEGINKFKNVDLKRVINEAAESYLNTEERKEKIQNIIKGSEDRLSDTLQALYKDSKDYTNVKLTEKQAIRASEIFEEMEDRGLDVSSSFSISSDNIIEFVYNSAIKSIDQSVDSIVDELEKIGIVKQRMNKVQIPKEEPKKVDRPKSFSSQVKDAIDSKGYMKIKDRGRK